MSSQKRYFGLKWIQVKWKVELSTVKQNSIGIEKFFLAFFILS